MPGLDWFVIAPSSRIAGLCHSIVRGEPYSTCSVACTYCYARWYRGPHGKPRAIWDSLRLVKAMARLKRVIGAAIPVRVAALSDPFQPGEEERRAALKLLRLAGELGVPVILNTRLPPPGREWWEALEGLAVEGLLVMQVTVTGLDDDWPILSKLEPGSPPPGERLRAAGEATDRGIPVALRLQPLIPGIGDRDPSGFVREAALTGARLLIVEFLRVEWEVLDKLRELLGGESEAYEVAWESYAPLGGEAGVAHPPLEYRLRVAGEYSRLARAAGLAFQTCKEGLFHLHHPLSMDCCGFSLLGAPWLRRPHLWDLYRAALERDAAGWSDVLEECGRSKRLLCGAKLEGLPGWLRRPLRLHERRLERILSRPQLAEAIAPSLAYDPNKGLYRARFRPEYSD